MEIKLSLSLHTEPRYGGNRGVITMFTKTVILTSLTGKQLVNWIEHGYIQIDDWTFRPKDLVVIDNGTCVCEGCDSAHISKKYDTETYYKSLTAKGWIPNCEHAKAIQCDGYPNFKFWLY